ncbi:MFS transporter [bacterium]|nr:MFS transporter [bacterium]
MASTSSGAGEGAQVAHHPPASLTPGQLMRLSALWFGLQFFWATNQLIVMPGKVREFVPLEQLGMFRTTIDSVGALLVIVTQLTIGYISDHSHSRIGRRKPFILFGILTGLGGIVFFMLAPGYWWLFLAYLTIQFCLNVASVPFQTLLPDLVPEKQHSKAGAIMGMNHVSAQILGLVVYIVMLLLFAGHIDRGLIVFLLPLYIVVLTLTTAIVVLGVDELGWMQHARRGVEGVIAQLRILPGTIVRYRQARGGLLVAAVHDYMGIDLRRQPNFCWLALSRFAIFFAYTTFLDYANYYTIANLDGRAWLMSMGLDPDTFKDAVFPAMMIFFLIGALLGNIASAPLAEWQSKKRVIGGGLVLAGVLVIPLILTSSVWTAVVSGFFLGMGWGAFLAQDWAFAVTLMPKQKAGSFMGMWTITGLVPATLSPLVSGPLRDWVYNSNVSAMGERAAEATAHQWVFGTMLVYFAIGLWLLRYVKEERAVNGEG